MSCSEIGIENSHYFLQQSSTERRIITNLASRAYLIMGFVYFDFSLVSCIISFVWFTVLITLFLELRQSMESSPVVVLYLVFDLQPLQSLSYNSPESGKWEQV